MNSHDHEAERCAVCGHLLSAYTPPEPSEGERAAAFLAARVASWAFPLLLVAAIAAWVIWNVASHPFQPYPVIIFAVISAVLASFAALQAPLILMTQRAMAERDRRRDEETMRIAARSEGDIHRLAAAIDAIAQRLDRE